MTLTINADGSVTVTGFSSKRAEPTAVEQSAAVMQAELVRLHGICQDVHRDAADALAIDIYGTTMPETVAALARQYRKARTQVAESHAERVSYADLHRGISDALGLAAPTDAQLVEAVRDEAGLAPMLRAALDLPDTADRADIVQRVRRLIVERRDADIAAAASVAAPQGGYAAGRAGALAEAATFRRRVCDALGLGFGAGDDVVVERAEMLVERAHVSP